MLLTECNVDGQALFSRKFEPGQTPLLMVPRYESEEETTYPSIKFYHVDRGSVCQL